VDGDGAASGTGVDADPETIDPASARRRPLVLGVAAAAAILVGSVAVLTVRWSRSASASACSTIPVGAGAPVDARPLTPGHVLAVEASSNGLSSWNGLDLVVDDMGAAVGIAEQDPPFPITYRRAQLDPATVDGLRACLDSPAFRSLDALYDEHGFVSPKGLPCQIGDASNYRVSAGPASGATKSVSVYDLADEVGGCRDPRAPALQDLGRALRAIEHATSSAGSATDAPAPELEPGR
jgi:hypothetical protein